MAPPRGARAALVPDELWTAAQSRISLARATYTRADRGIIVGRRLTRDHDSPYLLSGLAECAVCRGSIVGMSRDARRPGGRRPIYGCAYYHKRGPKVCTNSLLIRQEVLDAVVLDAIARALDAQLLEDAVDEALSRARGLARGRGDRRAALEDELRQSEKASARLVEAITRGVPVDSLLARLKAEEDRQRGLRAALDTMAAPATVVRLDDRRLRGELRARVADIRNVLGRNVKGSRELLGKLVVGKLSARRWRWKTAGGAIG